MNDKNVAPALLREAFSEVIATAKAKGVSKEVIANQLLFEAVRLVKAVGASHSWFGDTADGLVRSYTEGRSMLTSLGQESEPGATKGRPRPGTKRPSGRKR